MGDSVIEEAMIASSLIDDSMIDGSYDAYADMSSFSANLCDVVQDDDDVEMYGTSEDQETYTNRTKRLICKRCGKAFRNKILLKRHSAMHAKEMIFECEECYKKFNRKESLTRHMLVHTGMKFYECQECGRMFNQNGHLRTHMLIHTKEKNFECERCNMKFARKDNLKRHSVLHSRRKTHECTICGKMFNQNGHLEAHMLVHTQQKNYQCQQCFMKFARRDTLKRHMLVHTKEKTYECDFCYERFIQNSHLKAHVLVHTREKKFRCTDCDKKFARKGSLKRHMLVHTGERNFECMECGKTFIQKTHLNKHQLIHVGARDKMSEDRVDEFIQNIHKVEVHIEHLSPPKSDSNDEVCPSPIKTNVDVQPNTEHLVVESAPLVSLTEPMAVKSNSHEEKVCTPVSLKETPTSVSNMSCITKVSSPSCKNVTATFTPKNSLPNIQPQNILPAIPNNPQPCQSGSTATFVPQNLATKQAHSNNLPVETPGHEVAQMQPSNLLANSNSVMALALIDHFLTGNESQDNVGVAGPSTKNKASNQWAQKTQQELLAAQTLSAIGQRTTLANDNHHHIAYGHSSCINPQVTSYNPQPVPHRVIDSGPPHAAAKIKMYANPEWTPQEKVHMAHPHSNHDNVNPPPPPAHELFRYYSTTNMPLSHPSINRDLGQFKDGIVRLPEGSCLPADMRASPRKPKFPQKMIIPINEWQSQLPISSGPTNANLSMYIHGKHPSELPPRSLDKP